MCVQPQLIPPVKPLNPSNHCHAHARARAGSGRSWEPADLGEPLTARPPCASAAGSNAALFEHTQLEMRVADPARRLRGADVDKYLLHRAERQILAPEVQGADFSSCVLQSAYSLPLIISLDCFQVSRRALS